MTKKSLPDRLRAKSKGWKLVRGKYLSETPQLLVDAAEKIEELELSLGVIRSFFKTPLARIDDEEI